MKKQTGILVATYLAGVALTVLAVTTAQLSGQNTADANNSSSAKRQLKISRRRGNANRANRQRD